jgi:hypothetical protein
MLPKFEGLSELEGTAVALVTPQALERQMSVIPLMDLCHAHIPQGLTPGAHQDR